jgi:hypothetical protein
LDLRDVAHVLTLPWSHYVKLLGIKKPEARKFFEEEALRGGWTVRQLARQIYSQFYERTALSRNKAAMLKKGIYGRCGAIWHLGPGPAPQDGPLPAIFTSSETILFWTVIAALRWRQTRGINPFSRFII